MKRLKSYHLSYPLIVLSTIAYVYRMPLFGINISVFRLIFLVWLGIFVIDVSLAKIRFRKGHVVLAALFFLILMVNASDLIRMTNWELYGRDVANHLVNLGFAGIISVYASTKEKVNYLIKTYIVCSIIALAISCFVLYTGHLPFEAFLREAKSIYMPNITDYTIYYGSMIRLASSFYDPNFYGLYLCLVIIFIIYYKYYVKNGFYLDILLFLNIVALIFTLSRTAWVGLFVIFAVSVAKIPRFRTTGILVTLFIFALIVAAALFQTNSIEFDRNSFYSRIDDARSVVDRFHYIANGVSAFVRNPLFGVGSKGLVTDEIPIPSAHLVYLSLLAKYGVIGFAVYALFIFYPLFYVYRERRLENAYRYLIVCIYSAILVMYLAYDFFAFLEFQYLMFGMVYSIIINRIGVAGRLVPGVLQAHPAVAE